MTDLDLRRKTLEACGWFRDQFNVWHAPNCVQNRRDLTVVSAKLCEPECLRNDAPACESDDGIALKMLREFCGQHNLQALVLLTPQGVEVQIRTRSTLACPQELLARYASAVFAVPACRAIINAKKKL